MDQAGSSRADTLGLLLSPLPPSPFQLPRVIEGGVEVNNFQPPGPLPILPTSNGNGASSKSLGLILRQQCTFANDTPNVNAAKLKVLQNDREAKMILI